MQKPSTPHPLGIKFGPANLENVSKATSAGSSKSAQHHAPNRVARESSSASDQDYVTHAGLLRLASRKVPTRRQEEKDWDF